MSNERIQASDIDPLGGALQTRDFDVEESGSEEAMEGTVLTPGEDSFLSLDQILAAPDITDTVLPIPEWGGKVLVRSITKRQLDAIRKAARGEDDDYDMDAVEREIFIIGLVSPKVDRAAYEQLLDKSASAMNKVTKAILGTSKMGEGEVKNEERQFPAGQ